MKDLVFTQQIKDSDGAFKQEVTMRLRDESSPEVVLLNFLEFMEISGYDIDAEQIARDLGLKNRFSRDWNTLASM